MGEQRLKDPVGLKWAEEYLGVSRFTVRQWVLSGKLPGWKIGSQYKVERADVQACIKRVRPAAPAGGAK